ncbi:hypothetical protein ACFL3U_05365 [Pseudomonadota bacterium]
MTPEEHKAWQEKVAEETRELAQPINLSELEAQGVISVEGDWYRIYKFAELPEEAKSKIAELSSDDKGIKAKFIDTTQFAGVAAKLGK